MHCLIIEDDSIGMLGLTMLLRTHLPTWTLATATTVSDAIAFMREEGREKIDLIMLSIAVPYAHQAALFSYLKNAAGPSPARCVAISGVDDEDVCDRYREYGVSGYIPKSMVLKEQVSVLKAIGHGAQYFPYGRESLTGTSVRPASGQGVRLTARQKDLVRLIFAGYSNKQIAADLGLSYGTVKNYMFDLMRLLAVNSRLELTVKLREDVEIFFTAAGAAPKVAFDRRYQ